MLDDKTAIVTGSSRGLGREIAVELAQNGANVVVADIESKPSDGARPTHELVADEGVEGRFVETDVSDPDAMRQLMNTIDREFDTLDILVNNAGLLGQGRLEEITVQQWRDVINVNLTGTFLCCKFALDQLLDSEGDVVNISSIAGLEGSPNAPAYCASKAGIANFTRQIVVDYADQGLRANSIHPGPIDTASNARFAETDKGAEVLSRIPSGELGDREHVAGSVVFLVSPEAEYVNGHALVIDGGVSARYY